MYPGTVKAGMRGFTIIEMILVIVVVGAIFAIGAAIMGRAFESYRLTREVTDADWQGRVALERMMRELREIRTLTAADLDFSSNTQVWFIDTDGNGVCFYRDAATSRLMRSAAASSALCSAVASSPQPLADNIPTGGLNFFYYTNGGGAPAAATQVYYIAATLGVAEGQINETYRATVTPRNY